MFSRIVSELNAPINALYRERDALLARGGRIIDLISGNVHPHGILYPQKNLARIWAAASREARFYQPDPLGQAAAREAIRDYYRDQGLDVPARQIVLTPGTSISYWYCLKLLADPGDEVLSPVPAYPLLDPIARLADVRLVPYRLVQTDTGWRLPLETLRSRITPRTRAMVLVSPHNPTGMVADEAQIARLAEILRAADLPLIVDEVFGEFLFDRDRLPRPAATETPLVFTLNGLSKTFALPGMKIGWILVTGEERRVAPAMDALETISDTFLPVNEPAQCAVPGIFREGRMFLESYRARIRARREIALATLVKVPGLRPVAPQGGFYLSAGIEAPKGRTEETIAVELLSRHGVLIHPGYFYDFDSPFLVVSFVAVPRVLRAGLGEIGKYFGGR